MKTNHLILFGMLAFLTVVPFSSQAQTITCKKLFSDLVADQHNTTAKDYSRSKNYQVRSIYAPQTVSRLAEIFRDSRGPISFKGGGFSMGGQTIAEKGIVIDTANLNRILSYNPSQKTITVEGGITWREIQERIDGDDLAIKIMQSYNNFSVAGSLSVNVHGRYVGYGPVISSVREIKVLLPNGNLMTASRTENSDLFFGAIGGYGAFGYIAEISLDLAPNRKIERFVREFKEPTLAQSVKNYVQHFVDDVENNDGAVMTNADLYPPNYNVIRSSTYVESKKPLTTKERLQSPVKVTSFFWELMSSMEQLFSKVKLLRATVQAPRELEQERVVMQNYEASYDVNGLMSLNDKYPILRTLFPFSNRKSLLQEYFIPRDQLPQFIEKMAAIFKENNVNVTNVSLRHVPKNTESILSWSKEEGFAVVIYYTQTYGLRPQKNMDSAKAWTQKMLNEVIASGGSFYLPYQVYATREQFEKAYPRHQEFYSLKKKYDPENRMSNNLWKSYGQPQENHFYADVMNSPEQRSKLKAFFTHVFNIREPDQFMNAIDKAFTNLKTAGRKATDQNIYDELTKILPETAAGIFENIKKQVASLKNQQMEMTTETQQLMKHHSGPVNGYVEIGTKGRYISYLRNVLGIRGKTYVVTDAKPGLLSVPDILERTGGYGALNIKSYLPAILRAKFVDMKNYDMITQAQIPNESIDLATIYIGLHHVPLEKLRPFIASIHRILRPGGKLILRDHDATDDMQPIVHLAHSTYNAGLGIPFAEEQVEIRNFQPVSYWKNLMRDTGFKDMNLSVLQDGDPTLNTLMMFEKPNDGSSKSPVKDPNALTSIPNYHRAQTQTYMTQPEWFLVDIFTEFAAFMKHTPWYEFPFQKFIDLYQDVYQTHREFAKRQGLVDEQAFKEYDEMDKQLLLGNKLLFKAMQFAANQVKKGMNGQVVDDKTHFTAEIDKEALDALPAGIFEEVTDLQENLRHIQTERYMPFTKAIIEMAKKGAVIKEVAGNEFISVLMASPHAQFPAVGKVQIERVMTYQYPTARFEKGTQAYFHSIKVPVKELSSFVNQVDGTENKIVRIHDF